MSSRPNGTLSQKIQFHEMPLTTAPPTSGPKATARPLIPPHAPSARPRFSAGTAEERIVSVSGMTIAPPTPWTARATSSATIDGASAAAAEAAVEAPRPRLVGVLQAHRGHDVDEHALREERGHALRRQPGHTLDVGDEVAEPVGDDLADLGVV